MDARPDPTARAPPPNPPFLTQGVGRVLCAIILLISAYTIENTDWQWRFAILFGAVPMLACLRFRWLPYVGVWRRRVVHMCIHAQTDNRTNLKQSPPHRESEVFQEDVGKVAPAERLMAIAQTVYENRRKLLGTAGSWFILDVVR